MTNIMLVDDLQYARLGYKLMLGKASDITIVAQAGDGRQAITEIKRLESAGGPLPDVVLMDVRMPVMDGITATREITRRWPTTHVLILTTYDEDDYAYGGLDAGASGFLLKDASAAAVKDAIHAVANGDAVVTPRITRQILEHGMPRPAADCKQQALRDSFAALPPRQREICSLIRGRHGQRGNRPQTGTGTRDDTTNHQPNSRHAPTPRPHTNRRQLVPGKTVRICGFPVGTAI